MLKLLIVFLVGVLIFLQYKLWMEHNSFAVTKQIKQEIAFQKQQNQRLRKRNRILMAEVKNLKHGHQAVEERARDELGMIKQGEQFYQIVH